MHERFKINSYGTMRQNWKRYPKQLARPRVKKEDLSVKYTKNMIAMSWIDKREIFLLISMHDPVTDKRTV